MKLILFELKKMIRTKGVPILLLLTVLFICGLFMRNVIQQDVLQTKKIEKFSKYDQMLLVNTKPTEKKY